LYGKNKAVWQIATLVNGTFPSGIVAFLVANMDAVSVVYASSADIEEWTIWLRISLSQAFGAVMFPKEVYNEIVYSVENYEYGDPRVFAAKASPTCTAGTQQITCDEDPTDLGRNLLLWRIVNNEYVEQDPVALGYSMALDAGTWTISDVPANTDYIVSYDDDMASFPTFPMDVSAP
jgi:hypothetical protein